MSAPRRACARPWRPLLVLLPLLGAGGGSGCSGAAGGAGADMDRDTDRDREPGDLSYVSNDPLVVARPYAWFAPDPLDAGASLPLVILLHGFRATGFVTDRMLRLSDVVDARRFLYAVPEGSRNADGYSHWNSGGDPSDTDDVAYLDAVIADMGRRFRVDAARIYVVGHSNGAAMAYRYGCLRADRIAAIVPVSGTYTSDPARCTLARPLSQLQVYSDGDPGYPGTPPVRDQSAFFAALDGCGAQSDTSAAPVHLGKSVAGANTRIERWTGCARGSDVQFWLVAGEPHNIQVDTTAATLLLDWMLRLRVAP